MGLYISALEYVMKVILCSCVLQALKNRICKHCYARMILHNLGEVYIPEPGRYISALKQARVLI